LARNEAPYPRSSARAPTGADDTRALTTPSGVVDLYSQDPGFLVAVAGPYTIQIAKGRPTMMALSTLQRAFADQSDRYEKFGFLAIVEPDAPLLLAPDVRNGFDVLVKRYSPRFTGAAIVYERTGFQATALRSLITAINIASRATHPNQVFSDLREGVCWLSKLTAAEPTPTGLVHIVQRLRLSLQGGG
jgi:hypothetical protein